MKKEKEQNGAMASSSLPETETLEIYGDHDLLFELQKFFRSDEINARIRTSQYCADGALPTHALVIIAAIGAIPVVLTAFISATRQSRKVIVESDGKKIEVEGRSVEEVRQLLAIAHTVFIAPKDQ